MRSTGCLSTDTRGAHQWQESPPRSSATCVTVTDSLVADPELRYTASGIPVSRMRLAVRGTDGIIFQDVVAWNRLAEVAAEYLSKGRGVRVEGRLRGRMWAGSYDVDIIASGVEFLPPRAASKQAFARLHSPARNASQPSRPE